MAHLTRFGLKNFRIFEEYTDFEFAPITVFTGTNSSGKSSVLKALQLLKHNFDENLKSRLRKYDWNIEDLDFSGNNHQLGNFLTTKNNNNKFREISFSMPFVFTNIIEEGRIEFTYQLDDESEIKNGKLNQLVIQFKLEGKYSDVIKLKLEKERYKKNPKISNDYGPKEGTTIHYWKVEIDFNFFREKLDFIVEGFRKLNKKKYIKEGDYYMLPDKNLNLYLKNDVTWWRLPEDNHRNEDYIKYSGFAEYFQKNLDTHLLPWHGILTENHIVVDFNYEGNKPFYDFNSSTYDHLKTPLYKIYQEVIKSSKNQKNNKKRLIQEEKEFFKKLRFEDVIPYPDYLTLGNPVIAFKNYISQLDRFINKMYFEPEAGIEEFTFLDWKRASYFLYDFLTEEFLHSLERTLSSFSNFSYLHAERRIVQRLYSYSTNTNDINQFLRDFEKLSIHDRDIIMLFLNQNLELFDIEGELLIESDTDGAGIKIVLKNKKKRTLLSDLGYGITQILNIMLKTALIGIKGNFLEFSYPKFITPKILYLEEPECNLHPNLQSKLSDFFIQASKVFNIQFIIETHSEYLVRKLQYLTAKEKIKPEDTAIYYFSASTKKNDDQGLVKRIHIYSDGSLSDNFGSGFYDEAINLEFDLLKLKNSNKN